MAAAGHDTLAKLIYAWNLPVVGGPIASRHTGAELMYYGGTVVEVTLAAVVMAQWYQISGPAPDADQAQVAERGAATQ
jgi:putative membrane protein